MQSVIGSQVELTVPPSRVAELGEASHVRQVTLPGRVIPCQFAAGFGPVVDEAVQLTFAATRATRTHS